MGQFSLDFIMDNRRCSYCRKFAKFKITIDIVDDNYKPLPIPFNLGEPFESNHIVRNNKCVYSKFYVYTCSDCEEKIIDFPPPWRITKHKLYINPCMDCHERLATHTVYITDDYNNIKKNYCYRCIDNNYSRLKREYKSFTLTEKYKIIIEIYNKYKSIIPNEIINIITQYVIPNNTTCLVK